MALSIIQRVTGNGLATAGVLGVIWWLVAAASGPEAYGTFIHHATSWYGYVVMIGLTLFFFQHLFSGLRYFVLDIGAGYELKTNKSWAMVVPVAAIAVTAAIWLSVFAGKL